MDKKLKIENYFFVIFAAGVGKRLGKLGKKIPKSLLTIRNKKILLINLRKLRSIGVKKINIVVGFKKEKIINLLKDFRGIDFNFINVKNYDTDGHGMSWYAIRKEWSVQKKPIIIMHADLMLNFKYLINIIKSKNQNLIGISTRPIIKNSNKKNWVVSSTKKGKINKIKYLKNMKFFNGEILGINKISKKVSLKIFKFMEIFFNKRNKKKPWEYVINKYIEKFPGELYILKNQNYDWININTIKDYNLAKKIF